MHVKRFSPEKKIQKRSWYSHGRQAIEGKSEERESGTMCNLQVQHSNWKKKVHCVHEIKQDCIF